MTHDCRMYARGLLLLIVVACQSALADEPSQSVENEPSLSVDDLLKRPILDESIPQLEVEAFTRARLLPMPRMRTAQEWEVYAERMRRDVLRRVVLRGEARSWARAKANVEWLETIEGGPGYQIQKLRYEAVPGLWIPALLYRPEHLEGRVPVVMNVNGHDSKGKVTDYKQIRCINQAKRGMIALNVEWLGMGQLKGPNYQHTRMNQLDLCGTSGLAPFFLSMRRGIDLLLALPHADPQRVAVAGLSGGGWQTIIISGLDRRVTLANPVAGYSAMGTRIGHHSDMGDSEQAPTDLAAVTDYEHLTAMRAPRPTLLTYNAKDNCCFQADHALPTLVEAARPVFALYGCAAHLRTHVNHDPGTHNFELDNRQQLYRMFGDFFFPDDSDYDAQEIPSQEEVKKADALMVTLPEQNADFHSLALEIAERLPRASALPTDGQAARSWQRVARERLKRCLHAPTYHVTATACGEAVLKEPAAAVRYWWLRLGGDWTVPAVELAPDAASETVLLIADAGRAAVAEEAQRHLAAGHRVVAIDPFYFGESKIKSRDNLFALLVASVGERPLGIQAAQVAAVARWASRQYHGDPVMLEAVGRRTSLIGLVAAALDRRAIASVRLCDSLASLKEIVEQNLTVKDGPEMFCFGLLREFDICQIAAIVAPRQVVFTNPSERAREEFSSLATWYRLFGEEYSPLAEPDRPPN
ncbi:MAG: alpha/beta hydrolase family protein [Pirellulales bacterium]